MLQDPLHPSYCRAFVLGHCWLERLGESTILCPPTRLDDSDEGVTLSGGHDIQTLKLHGLRQTPFLLF